MLNDLIDMLGYDFILRGVIVGMLISVCAALLGVSLVLKRYSMIGDGLSHVGFGALAIATVFNIAPLKVAIPVVIAAAFLLLRISESSRIKGDSAIALISTGSLAFGVMAISVKSGINIDINNYMFGSILALTEDDLILSIVLAAVIIPLFIIFYNKIYVITFDESFARAAGIKAGFYNTVLAVLTAVTIVLGMRLMGTLLISSLIIFPPLTSMRFFKSFRGVVISSAIIPVISFTIGISVSYLYSTPPGASVVIMNILMFILFSAAGFLKSVKVKKK